ncbi:hypothetical protein Ae201684_007731 [Aphanomyces euteiches]|nr:hypothetical protein Ae201684_007731 [Aphanomyces euteiches]
MHGHNGAVNAACFSSDMKWTASGGVDSLVMIWNTDLDKCLHPNDSGFPMALPKSKVLKHSPPSHPSSSSFHAPSMPPQTPPVVTFASSPKTVDAVVRPFRSDQFNPAAIVPAEPTMERHIEDEHVQRMPQPPSRQSPPRSPTLSAAPSMSVSPLPDHLTATFDHIVGQLEIITRTLSILEERLCHAEDRITDVARVQSQMLRQQNVQVPTMQMPPPQPQRRPTQPNYHQKQEEEHPE